MAVEDQTLGGEVASEAQTLNDTHALHGVHVFNDNQISHAGQTGANGGEHL